MSAPEREPADEGPSDGGFGFEQTQMSSDRTLMATVRTSLSLISFGFTIYQVLGRASAVLPRASATARNVGLALLTLGLVTLAMGLLTHSMFSRGLALRDDRAQAPHMVRRAVRLQMASTYVSALSLLLIGLAALTSIALRLSS